MVYFQVPLVPEPARAKGAHELGIFAALVFGVFVQGRAVLVAFAASGAFVAKV